MPPKRLVLDTEFSYGLIYRAYVDGYAKPYSQSALQNRYSQEVLKIGSRPEVQQELLPSLLLYESIEIEPFDNFILYSSNMKGLYPKKETDQNIIVVGESIPRYIFGIGIGDEVKKYLDYIPPEMIVDLLHGFLLRRRNVDINKDVIIKALKKDIPESYDMLSCRYFELYSQLHESKLAPLLSSLLGLPYKARSLNSAAKNKIAKQLKNIEALLSIYEPIASAYTYIARKLTYCENANAHLRSTFLPVNPTALRESNVNQLASDKSDEWSTLVGVVFTNMPWIRPRSYEEFFQLSENKNIQDFRNFFHESLEKIMEGETTLEKVSEKARNAAKAVERIRRAEELNTITFWISIPIGILSFLLSSGVSLGVSLALASPKLYSYIESRRYQWALVDVALKRI